MRYLPKAIFLFAASTTTFMGGISANGSKAEAEDIKVECPKEPLKAPAEAKNRKDTYKGTPFQPGEEMVYETSYGGMKAGYGTLSVEKPRKHKGNWHRVFRVKAKTGDWFSSILVAEEKIEALSRGWDWGAAKFYLEQNEGKIFSKPFQQQKWLEYNHDNCKVSEKIKPRGEKPTEKEFDFAQGGLDVLSVVYWMRTQELVVGKPRRVGVYSSEKNWWLEIDPVNIETVEVPAGKFKAMKVKLQTYIGKDLQQKGDVFAWIGIDRASKPVVQIQGEIKIGSVWLKLKEFKEGKPL